MTSPDAVGHEFLGLDKELPADFCHHVNGIPMNCSSKTPMVDTQLKQLALAEAPPSTAIQMLSLAAIQHAFVMKSGPPLSLVTANASF